MSQMRAVNEEIKAWQVKPGMLVAISVVFEVIENKVEGDKPASLSKRTLLVKDTDGTEYTFEIRREDTVFVLGQR